MDDRALVDVIFLQVVLIEQQVVNSCLAMLFIEFFKFDMNEEG